MGLDLYSVRLTSASNKVGERTGRQQRPGGNGPPQQGRQPQNDNNQNQQQQDQQ